MTFFGTLEEAKIYFDGLGFPMPSGCTPTDHFLQVTGDNAGPMAEDFDFPSHWDHSVWNNRLCGTLDRAIVLKEDEEDDEEDEEVGTKTSGWRQFKTLLKVGHTSQTLDKCFSLVSSESSRLESLWMYIVAFFA